MKNEILHIRNEHWLIRKAVSYDAAINEINIAKVSGSIGGKSFVNGNLIADVVQLNSDGSERKAYECSY